MEAPLSLTTFRLSAVAPQVARMDEGVAWPFDVLDAVSRAEASSA